MKPFIDSELILRAAERLRPTCSFTVHDNPSPATMARVGDVIAWGDTAEAATRKLAKRVAERLAAQIDHDTQLVRQLLATLEDSDFDG